MQMDALSQPTSYCIGHLVIEPQAWKDPQRLSGLISCMNNTPEVIQVIQDEKPEAAGCNL